MAQPEVYDQSVSLKAGINMLRLTRRLRRAADGAVIELPTMLAFTEADRTVGWGFTQEFIGHRFTDLGPTVRYARDRSIPHQIVVPAVNPEHEQLFATVGEFLQSHFETQQ